MRHSRILFVIAALLTAPAYANTASTAEARAIVMSAPDYPARAKSQGIEGLVMVQVEVNAQGKPVDVRAANSEAHPALQSAAIESIKNWQFAPALKDGQPVSSTLQIPLRFELLAQRKRDRRVPGPATLKAVW